MADLVNLLDHMRGKGVLVNGTIYPIDAEGIAKNVSEEDAAKLLGSDKWMVYDPKAAAKREERRKLVREQFKQKRGSIQLIKKDGGLVDPEEMKKAAEAEKAKAKAQELVKAQAAAEAKDEYPSMNAEEKAAPVEKATEAPLASEGDPNEWPDPDMTMAKPYLQDMAKAYGVTFKPQTKKQELVDLILKAMYDGP